MTRDPPSEVETDWHWLAGIFEGEGFAGICHPKNTTKPKFRRTVLSVNISQRETTMLVEVMRIAGCGCIHPANRKDGKPLFMWQCKCASARHFLTMLLPYIRSNHKKEQVRKALSEDASARELGRIGMAFGRSQRWKRAA